jgi:hypothetical protein
MLIPVKGPPYSAPQYVRFFSMREEFFLVLQKLTNLIILSANDYRTSPAQILDLAGHMDIPITAGPTTSWGMSISRSLIERLRQEQIPT